MSRRTSITKSLAEKFKDINGAGAYTTNIYDNSYPILKFWDEVEDFPCIYMTPGAETRQYLPGNFTWSFLSISIKLYTKGEDAQDQLEDLIEDVQKCIDANRVLIYDPISKHETTEILVNSIITDEGLLAPYSIGEITVTVQYQLMI